jgi:hypothetical protein
VLPILDIAESGGGPESAENAKGGTHQGERPMSITWRLRHPMPDERIVIKAQVEGRTIITHDLDFGRIVALSGDPVHGTTNPPRFDGEHRFSY